jgi:hypothetical protein
MGANRANFTGELKPIFAETCVEHPEFIEGRSNRVNSLQKLLIDETSYGR